MAQKVGGADGCPRCGQAVYAAEKVIGAGKVRGWGAQGLHGRDTFRGVCTCPQPGLGLAPMATFTWKHQKEILACLEARLCRLQHSHRLVDGGEIHFMLNIYSLAQKRPQWRSCCGCARRVSSAVCHVSLLTEQCFLLCSVPQAGMLWPGIGAGNEFQWSALPTGQAGCSSCGHGFGECSWGCSGGGWVSSGFGVRVTVTALALPVPRSSLHQSSLHPELLPAELLRTTRPGCLALCHGDRVAMLGQPHQ